MQAAPTRSGNDSRTAHFHHWVERSAPYDKDPRAPRSTQMGVVGGSDCSMMARGGGACLSGVVVLVGGWGGLVVYKDRN